ncbi:hypothetical protein E4U41_004611, partial [Claviceps citrina]
MMPQHALPTGAGTSSGSSSAAPDAAAAAAAASSSSSFAPPFASSALTTRHARKRASSPFHDDGPRRAKRLRETRDEDPAGNNSNSDDDEDEDEDEDNSNNNPQDDDQAGRTRGAPSTNLGLIICDFCKNHPTGRQMHQTRPCNWRNIGGKYILECQNCADYRFDGHAGHVCCIGRKKQARPIYATQHPVEYPEDSVCDNCKALGYHNTCDADPILGLSCTSCVTAKPTPAEKARHDLEWESKPPAERIIPFPYLCNICRLVDRILGPKPNLRQGYFKWFRHACDICKNRGKKKNDHQCSWLRNRSFWDRPCSRCLERGMLCMCSGEPVGRPVVPPGAEQ